MHPYIMEKDGKPYMYRSTSHYSKEKGGPVSEVEYMGRVVNGKLRPKKGYMYNEETGEFGPIVKEAAIPKKNMVITTKIAGDVYLLNAIQKRQNLLFDLIAAFGSVLGKEMMALGFAYCIHPSAMMHLGAVIERRNIKETLELPEDTDFSSPRISEITEEIGNMAAERDEFFRRRITGSEGELLFDLTTESTYSTKNPAAEWGRNKDHDKLKQIGLGLVTDRNGIPAMFYVYPGSVADITTLYRMVKDVKRLGGHESTLVLDRGFESAGSVYFLLKENVDFVMPMIIGDNPIMKALVTETLNSIGDVDKICVYDGESYTVVKSQIGVRKNPDENREKRKTVWEDPDGYDLVAEGDKEYGSCEGYLDVFVFRNVKTAGVETANMDVALNNIINQMEGKRYRDPAKSFAKHAGPYANMLDWEMKDDGMHVSMKQNAHTFAANRKGIFVMISPVGSGRTWKEVLMTYELRDIIEDAFFQDKNEGDGRRPRSGKKPNIIGRTMIRMVANIMRMYMVNRISEYSDDKTIKPDQKPRDIDKQTPESLLSSLSNIEMVYINGGNDQMTEMTRCSMSDLCRA